jgi:hypothetical protein
LRRLCKRPLRSKPLGLGRKPAGGSRRRCGKGAGVTAGRGAQGRGLPPDESAPRAFRGVVRKSSRSWEERPVRAAQTHRPSRAIPSRAVRGRSDNA